MTCRLITRAASLHLQQIYTGFRILEKKGLLTLRQTIASRTHRSGPAHLTAILNDEIQLHYDAHDSWRIDSPYLQESDFYFKRSYLASAAAELGEEGRKVMPLGLNYLVYPDGFDRHALRRAQLVSSPKGRLQDVIRSLGAFDWMEFSPRTSAMEAPPESGVEPRILFMARVFDPAGERDLPQERIDEIHELNRMRAECVRRLRAEFGSLFFGGLARTEYAERHFGDALLPDADVSSKKNYLTTLRGYPICVSTAGLHGSIGWKFGEYVAFSKAIVSERLVYEVPGDLGPDRNYLEFETPDECVEHVGRLVDDKELRGKLMANNQTYYQRYVRPEALVANTIEKAVPGAFGST